VGGKRKQRSSLPPLKFFSHSDSTRTAGGTKREDMGKNIPKRRSVRLVKKGKRENEVIQLSIPTKKTFPQLFCRAADTLGNPRTSRLRLRREGALPDMATLLSQTLLIRWKRFSNLQGKKLETWLARRDTIKEFRRYTTSQGGTPPNNIEGIPSYSPQVKGGGGDVGNGDSSQKKKKSTQGARQSGRDRRGAGKYVPSGTG